MFKTIKTIHIIIIIIMEVKYNSMFLLYIQHKK